MASKSTADDPSLKRLGGGRWQTRDERFTIEPDSGTWVVVDAEQTDDLGLPLVRGPFRSLGDAKEAIAAARSSPPDASPLAERIGRPPAEPAERSGPRATAPEPAPGRPTRSGGRAKPRAVPPASTGKRFATEPDQAAEPVEAAEPRWLASLEPDERRRARRLIARLEKAGARDPEGMARRDIVGEVPAVAAFAIERRLDDLGPEADPEAIAALLADGRDDDLGVRWRLVDDDNRPITLGRARRHSDGERAR
jgi:hypothetical protein